MFNCGVPSQLYEQKKKKEKLERAYGFQKEKKNADWFRVDLSAHKL